MKILVLGSTGLLGSAIVETLSSISFLEVHAPTRNSLILGRSTDLYKHLQTNEYDLLINCAARVGGLYSQIKQPAAYLSENLIILDDIYTSVSAITSTKPRIINFMSTCIFPADVDFPIEPSKLHNGPPHATNSSYSHAKRLNQVYSDAFFSEYGIFSTTFILGNLFGPRDHFKTPKDSHVIPSLITKAFEAVRNSSESISIMGNGRPVREFLYVYDAAHLIRNYLLSELFTSKSQGSSLLLFSNHDSISILQLAQMICELISPHKQMSIIASSDEDLGQHEKPSVTSKELIPLVTQLTSLKTALNETINWYSQEYITARSI